MVRQPRSSSRLLQLGWLCEIPNVETMRLDDLKDALEGRGFATGGDGRPVAREDLLPLTAEGDIAWLARRAATELAIDPDLRFLRYQNMVLPDVKGGQAPGLNGLGLSTALSAITKLLDPEQGKE